MTDYSHYQHLLFTRHGHGILLITINRPEVYNATNARLHWELSRVWLDIADDPATRVVVVTGAGPAFSAGGDLDTIESFKGDIKGIAGTMKEAADIVYNIASLISPSFLPSMVWRWAQGSPWPLWPISASCRKPPASRTGTCAWGLAPGTTRPSSGRCCVAWRKPSIIYSQRIFSMVRKQSVSV